LNQHLLHLGEGPSRVSDDVGMPVALKVRHQLALPHDPKLLIENMLFADLDCVFSSFGGAYYVNPNASPFGRFSCPDLPSRNAKGKRPWNEKSPDFLGGQPGLVIADQSMQSRPSNQTMRLVKWFRPEA